MTIETMENKKQILDNIPQRDTWSGRTIDFIVLDMLGILGDFPLDLMSPGIHGPILIYKTEMLKMICYIFYFFEKLQILQYFSTN